MRAQLFACTRCTCKQECSVGATLNLRVALCFCMCYSLAAPTAAPAPHSVSMRPDALLRLSFPGSWCLLEQRCAAASCLPQRLWR